MDNFSVLHIDFEENFRGSENQALLLHEKLLTDGVRSNLLVLAGSEIASRAREREAPQVYTVVPSRLKIGELDPWLISGIVTTVRNLKPDLVHTHTAQAAGLVFFAKPILPKAIKLVAMRTVTNPLRLFSAVKYRAFNGLIAVCESIRNDFLEARIAPGFIEVIHSGISLGNGCPCDSEAASHVERSPRASLDAADGITIGFLGALDRYQKDVETLIRSYALARHNIPNATLLIFGDGVDRRRLERLTREMGLQDCVVFKGWWSRPLEEAYSEMDIFALPSIYEGTSNALIAAMASGLACVATRVGGNPDVLADAGMLVEGKNIESLAKALTELCRDKELRSAIARKSRERAKLFSVEAMYKKTIRFYQRVFER